MLEALRLQMAVYLWDLRTQYVLDEISFLTTLTKGITNTGRRQSNP
jgi:hypothetical protein